MRLGVASALLAGCLEATAAAGGSGRSRADALEAAFTGCPGEGMPFAVLNAFWSDLDRRYAVFPQRLLGLTWAEVGRAACAKLSPTTTDAALYEVLLEMARALDDGHTRVVADELGRRDAAWVTGYAHGDLMSQLLANVELRYLDGPLARGESPGFAWGRIGELGYLHLGTFEALSESVEEEDDTAAAIRIVAMAMRDFATARGLVVDLRANEGGWDEVQLAVARWFAGERSHAYSKQRRSGPGHADLGPPEAVWVEEGEPGAFAGRVIVLTSGWTFSAAETFALALRTRPRARLVGEPTSGHFSDLFTGQLPNGWSYSFSGELYRAADGEIYEARGVPVEIEAPFDAASFAQGRDSMLEVALSMLRGEPLP